MVAIKILYLMMVAFPLSMQAKEPIHDIKTKKTTLSYTSRIKPQDLLVVIKGQLNALRSKNIEKAYQDFTSIDFRDKISLEDFKKLMNQYTAFSDNKLFQFQSFYTEDDTASFGGDLLSNKGEYISVEYDLVLENGNWKILGIQIYQNELSMPRKESF